MKALILALLVAGGCLSSKAHATAQVGDFLDYEGKRVEIYSTPLEDLFIQRKDRPEFEGTSSACWRGYIGLWKIEKDTLFLVSIHNDDWSGESPLGKEIPLDFVFPKEKKKSPVEATWFTGVLKIPQGEKLRYVHAGFGTVHERDQYLTVKEGKITGSREVDNEGFGATLSTPDLQWVALGERPIEDDGDWVDARNLFREPAGEKVFGGEPITTRGIFSAKSEQRPGVLWVGESPTTEAVQLEIGELPEKPKIANGSHVEVVAIFDKETGIFAVQKIRELDPGESMHHPDFKAPEPIVVEPIRDFSIETIEQLGRELYMRDSLAAAATDLLMAKHPEAKEMPFGGWITELTEDAGKVYLLKATDDGVKQGYLAVFPFNDDKPTIAPHLDETIPDKIKVRYEARKTAIGTIRGFYERPYNFEVLDDPDGEGFLVYSLASTRDANEIIVGGHSRVTVSADGTTAESVDDLFKSLLILKKDEPQGEVVAAVMTHVVSPTPVETHVFQSLMHEQPFIVITDDETEWMIEEGEITKMKVEKAEPEIEGKKETEKKSE